MAVYVVQEVPGKNILPAQKFGTLIPLVSYHIGLFPDTATQEIQRKLHNFSDQDYLLLIGDPVAIGLATGIALINNKGKAQLLKWDRQQKEYYVVKIQL